MATNPSPTRISSEMWRFWEEFKAFETSVQLGGIYANKPGYHNYRANLPSTDYSVEEVRNDRAGSSQHASAIDLSLSTAKMKLYSKRLADAYKRKDKRLYVDGEPATREFIGTLDGTTVYCYMLTGGVPQGVGADSGPDPGRDKSHLYHIHISIIRKFIRDWRIYSGLLSILKNESLEDWEEMDAKELLNTDGIIENPYSDKATNPYITTKTALKAAALADIRTAEIVSQLKGVSTALAAIAGKVDLDPAEVAAIKAALAVPTAEQNAQAVVDALGSADTETLATTLKTILGPQRVAALVEALSS